MIERAAQVSARPRLSAAGPAAAAVAGTAMLVYLVTSLLGRAAQWQAALGEIAYLVPIAATIAGSFSVAGRLRPGLERRFWICLGAASSLLLVNEGYFSGRVVLGMPAEWGAGQILPLAAGLVASLLFVVVLLLMVRPIDDALVGRSAVDAAIVLALATLLLLALVVDPLTLGSSALGPIQVLSAFRMATGVLMIAGVTYGLVRGRGGGLRPYETLLFSGIAVFGLGLVLWPLWLLSAGPGGPAVVFYGVPLVFMLGQSMAATAAGLRLGDPEPRTFALEQARTSRPAAQIWLIPGVTLGVLVLIGAWVLAGGDPQARRVLAASLPTLAVLVIVRSLLLAYESETRAARFATDPVSGLGTMASLDHRLLRELEVAGRYGEQVSLIVVDLDHFGDINDSQGHREGDRALAATGDALRAAAASRDETTYAARTSGDEFAVVVPAAGAPEAFKAAIGIRMELESAAARTGFPLSASMGIAVYPEHASDVPGLLTVARDALQVAKSGEYGNVLVYDPLDAGARRVGELDAMSYVDAIRVLARSVEQRTPHLEGHGARVAVLATRLGRQLRLDEERLRLLEIAGELHDIGYIAVPDRVVEKPGPLDRTERRLVEGHADVGARILASLDLPEVLPWVRAHHERWDGRGYPRRLKGGEIPLGARILAVCDAFDAMTSERPYRRALRREEALEELGMGRASAFDPATVDEFFFMLSASLDRETGDE